jgi:hypothetical protein
MKYIPFLITSIIFSVFVVLFILGFLKTLAVILLICMILLKVVEWNEEANDKTKHHHYTDGWSDTF